jgi:hypothetical protein
MRRASKVLRRVIMNDQKRYTKYYPSGDWAPNQRLGDAPTGDVVIADCGDECLVGYEGRWYDIWEFTETKMFWHLDLPTYSWIVRTYGSYPLGR